MDLKLVGFKITSEYFEEYEKLFILPLSRYYYEKSSDDSFNHVLTHRLHQSVYHKAILA
jgi:hypothetical protein